MGCSVTLDKMCDADVTHPVSVTLIRAKALKTSLATELEAVVSFLWCFERVIRAKRGHST